MRGSQHLHWYQNLNLKGDYRVCGTTLISPPNPVGRKSLYVGDHRQGSKRGKTPNKEPKERTKKWL